MNTSASVRLVNRKTYDMFKDTDETRSARRDRKVRQMQKEMRKEQC